MQPREFNYIAKLKEITSTNKTMLMRMEVKMTNNIEIKFSVDDIIT